MHVQHFNQKFISAAELGLSAVTLAAERTSNTINCEGYSQLSIQIQATRDSYTRLDVNVEGTLDPASDLNWATEHTASIAAGTVTLSPEDFQNTTSSTITYIIDKPINRRHIRIKISATAGGTDDLATVKLCLATN